MHKSTTNPIGSPRAGLLAATAVLSVSPALAYVDPGTGSMLLQMGIAAAAGALFYFRQLRMAAADWFRRKVLRQPAAPEAAASDASGDSNS